MIEVTGVTYAYPGSDRDAVTGVDLAVHPGAVTVLLGANGSGKSTLAKMANGLIAPHEGRVTVDGLCAHEQAPRPACARRPGGVPGGAGRRRPDLLARVLGDVGPPEVPLITASEGILTIAVDGPAASGKSTACRVCCRVSASPSQGSSPSRASTPREASSADTVSPMAKGSLSTRWLK